MRFPGRSLPSLFVAFLCEFDSDCVLRTLCSMRASSPRVLDQESPQSAQESLLAGDALCRERGRRFCWFVVFVACFTVFGRLHVFFFIMPY